MKNKMLLIALVAVLALSIGLVGCEEPSGPTVELYLDFSDHNPPDNACARALTAYADYIESHSGGTVNITVYYAGSLVPQPGVWAGVPAGTADAASYVPEIGDGVQYAQVVAMPFMGWDSGPAGQQQAMDVFWNLCGTYSEILAQITSNNCTLATLYMMPGYQLNFYAANLTVDDPGDMSGKTMISLETNLANIIKEIPGAGATVMSFMDVLTNVPKETIGDGFAMHIEFCAFFGLLPHLRSHTVFDGGIMMCPIGVLWNTAQYNACKTKVTQTVMDDAAAQWASTFFAYTAADTALAADYWYHHPQTIVALNASTIVANGWDTAVAGYVTTWENACASNTTAAAIYAAAKALI